MQKPTVPDSIQTPAGEELVFMARATGFQIYVCRSDAESGHVVCIPQIQVPLLAQAMPQLFVISQRR